MRIDHHRFMIEEIGRQFAVTDMELHCMRDEARQQMIYRITRRLPVKREMFEEKEREKTSSDTESGTEVSHLMVANTWWDKAKQDVRVLQWAVRRGWLSEAATTKVVVHHVTNYRTMNITKHFRTEVTVLNNAKDLPAVGRPYDVRTFDETDF